MKGRRRKKTISLISYFKIGPVDPARLWAVRVIICDISINSTTNNRQ